MNVTALDIYREFFPDYQLAIYQEETLTAETVDAETFRAAVKYWAINGYKPNNLTGILSKYDELTAKRKSSDLPKNVDVNTERERLMREAREKGTLRTPPTK